MQLEILHKLTRISMFLGAALTIAAAPAAVTAAEWGDLTATFVFDGDAPKPDAVVVNKDQAVCGKHALVDESLLVNKESGGIKNVIVYLYVGRGDDQPEVHPSYEQTASEEVLLDNKNCRFEPHVTLLRTSQTLVLGNNDPVGHNTKIDTFTNSPINPILPAGGKLTKQFSAEERLPARVSCSIHPWMTGWLVVKDHPYMAVSDENGKLQIKNLPAGKWTFQVWHEKAGYITDVKQNGKAQPWRRGRVELTIKPGENNLGEISIAPAAFEK